jgi:hypothetical protein
MKATCLLLVFFTPILARADVVLDWNDVTLATIQRNATPPPVAAKALAMTHVAIYDAVNSVEPTHRPFRVFTAVSPGTSQEAAAAQAAYNVLLKLFPDEQSRLQKALADSLARVPDGPDKSAGTKLGEIVAGRIIDWRKDDGSQRSVSFTPGTQPGEWRPTPPDFKPALLPQWSTVKPFGITSGSQFRPAFPPKLDSAEYAHDLEEVRSLGARNSTVRTPEQTEIAYFWADGPGTVTPPGHWNRIAQTAARTSGLSLHENARLFALLNIALADAAVVCWDMKFACKLWRPVTAIQEADTDNNDQTTRDPNWRPLLDTPPFPSCTSGHSTFSGAAAEALALFFGRDDKVSITDTSGNPQTTRTFGSFKEAAEEAGRSRIYAGIHFQFDNRAGLDSGRALARYIFDHHFMPVSEPASDQLVARTAYRVPPDNNGSAAPTGEDQTRNTAPSAQAAATTSPVPVTTYAAPTVVYPAVTYVAQYAPAPAPYCGPVVAQYPAVTQPAQTAVTYYYVPVW